MILTNPDGHNLQYHLQYVAYTTSLSYISYATFYSLFFGYTPLRLFVNKMSFSILNWKHCTYVSQMQDLIKGKAFFVSTSSIQNFDFNFVNPLQQYKR